MPTKRRSTTAESPPFLPLVAMLAGAGALAALLLLDITVQQNTDRKTLRENARLDLNPLLEHYRNDRR